MKSIKHLLRLVGVFALTTVAITLLVACGDQAIKGLSTDLTEINLQEIRVKNVTAPTVDEIKGAFEVNNTNLNLDGISVSTINVTVSTALVTPNAKIYKGDPFTENVTVNG